MKKTEVVKMMNNDLRNALENMFFDSEVINAHGGFAVKKANTNKRAFEISYNKKREIYKICCHKQTTINAELKETADAIEQQNNYKFDNLDTDTAYEVMKLLYNNKTTTADEQQKLQQKKDKKRVITTINI